MQLFQEIDGERAVYAVITTFLLSNVILMGKTPVAVMLLVLRGNAATQQIIVYVRTV